jgi:ankyrin repeat protein
MPQMVGIYIAALKCLTAHGADIGRDKQGVNRIHYAAAGGHVAALELLIAKGADIGAAAVNG